MRTDARGERAARVLGDALRAVGFAEEAVVDMLGDDAYSSELRDRAAVARRLEPSPLGTVADLLLLGRAVSRRDAVRALGRRAVDALGTTGLAEVGAEVEPLARVVPLEELLVAGDRHSAGAGDPPDYVAPFSLTSRVCSALTPRRRVRTALDVGTGSGAQAVFAARHARRVVATDVNERALAFTRLNGWLNGLDNLDVRRGSLFEPVAGETFDLITCNAPYVISPGTRWLYRDSGFEGDRVSELVVRGAADHLADGGFATVNVSWLGASEDDPDERVLEWVEAGGCDAWILATWEADPLDHAAHWGEELGEDETAIERTLDEWTRYLADLGAGWVTEGTVVLHRRAGRRDEVRIDWADADSLEDASAQVERAFAARARLAELRRRDGLLDAKVARAASLELTRDLHARRSTEAARVALEDGTMSEVETRAGALDVLEALDGRVTVGAAIDRVARARRLDARAAARLRRDAAALVRDLLELGALAFER